MKKFKNAITLIMATLVCTSVVFGSEFNGDVRENYTYTQIDDILNDYQSDNQYIMSRVSNRGAFLDRIEASLDNYTPAVIDIDTRYVSWPYSTSGHFVNISGLDTDSNVNGEIRVTDPYWKKLGNHWYDIDVVYDAVTDHFNSAIIW